MIFIISTDYIKQKIFKITNIKLNYCKSLNQHSCIYPISKVPNYNILILTTAH